MNAQQALQPCPEITLERGRGQSINDDCIEKGSPKGLLIGCISVIVARRRIQQSRKNGVVIYGWSQRGRLLDGQLN